VQGATWYCNSFIVLRFLFITAPLVESVLARTALHGAFVKDGNTDGDYLVSVPYCKDYLPAIVSRT
jgi:multisubunit Na+/H+ antiporter MnhG subunit